MPMSNAAFKFLPFSIKQKKVLTWWTKGSPYKNFDMLICDGSVRSGKTVAMIDSYITWSLATFKDENFIIAGRSMGALKRNVIQPMLQILTAKGIPYRYHRSDHYITIGSNIYYCFGANNEASQDALQGLTAAGALGDEVALFPQSFIEQMIARCSVDGAKVWMNYNPESPYHFIKTDYIDKSLEKRILHLHFTLNDNLALPDSVKERYERLFTGLWYKRMILGLWVLAEGAIYDMFDEDIHKVPAINREYTEYYVSCDYGTQNPTVFGLWGKFENRWYKVKEYHYDGRATAVQKTDEEYYSDLNEFIGDIPIKAIIVDPSAASFIATIKKHSNFRVIRAKNEVLDGIRNVATALNRQMILYNDCCIQTFREFSSYVWSDKAIQRGEDKPVKQNDHHMDADRYFVNTILFGNKRFKTIDKISLGI